MPYDFDDDDDLFDDARPPGSAYDDGPRGALDPDALALVDGASADVFAARKAELTRILVGGETGVAFASLALFAEPLFSLYDLDAEDAFRLATEPEATADDTVALLETARVLWAFFSMPAAERSHKRQALAAQLVGEDPSEEDWLSLDGLLDAVLVHWKALLPDEIAAAEQTGHPTLDFDDLLHHPAFRVGTEATDATHAGFGPDGLSEVEARALFAQPLLDAAHPEADDAFEEALARADDYWHLATTAGPDAAAAGRAFARQSPGTSAAEAEAMIERFRALFPEHAQAR